MKKMKYFNVISEVYYLLDKLEKENSFSNLILQKFKSRENQQLAIALFYETLRYKKALLEAANILSDSGKLKANRKFKLITAIALAGILLFSISDSSFANACVEFIKTTKNAPKAGFLNAILRKASKHRKHLANLIKSYRISPNLDISYSIEKDFLELLKKDNFINNFSITKILSNFNNSIPTFVYRKNKNVNVDPEKLQEIQNNWYILKTSPANVDFENFYITSFSHSILEKILLQIKPTGTFLDACAFPGAKSIFLNEHNPKKLVLNDIVFWKLKKLRKSFNKNNCQFVCSDFSKCSFNKSSFDLVFIDAPCTHSGFVRRHPETKYNITKDKVKELVKLQKKLLKNAKSIVKDKGFIIYSVCSILEDETNNVIKEFLKFNKDFELIKIKIKLDNAILDDSMGIRVFPGGYFDGFYFAVLQKK